MTISQISAADVARYLRIDQTPAELAPIMEAAGSYIANYTGLSEDELDQYDDLWLAFMALCQDMYDTRCMIVDNSSKINAVVASILDSHRRNLL